MQFVLGVDEAGRGPLAGPVSVGVVMVAKGFDVAAEFPGVADSKQLSEKKREAIFVLLEARVAKGDARYVVEWGSEGDIDAHGIAVVVREAVARGVNRLAEISDEGQTFIIMLDGALRAPIEYRQQTIIGGDASVPLISLASIAAKVVRDRLMCRQALLYPGYGFEEHKGYGTKAHYAALALHGPCFIHRRTFIHLD
ncbi:MAG: ribonuclease HII [bacterium]|nr:ribonuclease HII [bacterium]